MEDRDPTDVIGLEELQARSVRSSRNESEMVAGDLRWLMEQKRGRRVVWRILEEAGIYRSVFHTSGSVMAFNEGQRNAGLRLLDQVMRAAPQQYMTMLEEHRK